MDLRMVRAELLLGEDGGSSCAEKKKLADSLDDPVTVRHILAQAFRDLMRDSRWDTLTYWDSVPEDLEVLYCSAALALKATNAAPKSLVHRALDTAAIFVKRPRLRAAIVSENETCWFKDVYIFDTVRRHAPHLVDIRSTAVDWPVFSEQVDPLEHYDDRYVPVEQDGRQRFVQLSEVARNADLPRSYLAQHRLFDQLPGLRRYFGRILLSEEDDPVVCAWIGARSVTSRHADPRHNTVVQISGVKRWRFFDKDGRLHSQFDLRPGQILFVPRLWTHAVESLGPDPAFAVSYWSSSDFI